MNRFIKNGAAILLSLCFTAACMEGVLRLYFGKNISFDIEMAKYNAVAIDKAENPKIGHIHKKNRRFNLMGVELKFNSQGLRDREYRIKKTARRVLFLGDSLTLGWGVKKTDTFEQLLEDQLNQYVPTEVLNFGTANYNTEQQVAHFIDRGLIFSPDQVIVFYFINDAEPTKTLSRWRFMGRFAFLTFIRSRMNTLWGTRKSFVEYYKGLYSEDSDGWIATKQAFKQLKQIVHNYAIELKVVLLPELHQLSPYPFADEYRKVQKFLKSENIASLDLTSHFSQISEPSSLWVANDDAHPNEEAHALIAKASFAFLNLPVGTHFPQGDFPHFRLP